MRYKKVFDEVFRLNGKPFSAQKQLVEMPTETLQSDSYVGTAVSPKHHFRLTKLIRYSEKDVSLPIN